MFSRSNAASGDTYRIAADIPGAALSVDALLGDIRIGEKICLPAFGQRYGETLAIETISAKTIGKKINRQHSDSDAGKSETKDRPQTEYPNAPDIDDAGCFSADFAGSLTVRYRIAVDRLPPDRYWFASKLSPRASSDALAIPGESLFIERAGMPGAPPARTAVEVAGAKTRSTLPRADGAKSAPAGARAAQNAYLPKSPDHVSGEKSVFAAESPYELTRSYWTFGDVSATEFKVGQSDVTLVYDKTFAPYAQTLAREAERIFSHYAQNMPSKTPKNVAIFVFYARFDANYRHGFARPGGIAVQLGRAAVAAPSARRILIAHELFHLYNGEGLRFSGAEYAQTAWFREGLTQYIALKTLRALSLLDDAQINDWLADALRRNASQNTQSDDFAYLYGCLLAMAIDRQWAMYGTQFTLTGFWKWLSAQPYWTLSYGNRGLRSILGAYSGFDFNDFFDRYVSRADNLPVDAILRQSGLCRYKAQELRFGTGLTYAADPHAAALIARKIEPQSPAAVAEIARGARIAPYDDADWTSPRGITLRVFKSGETGQNAPMSTIRLPAQAYAVATERIAPCSP